MHFWLLFQDYCPPPPSVLDGGTHILLANMLSPKRRVCSQDLHMAHPVPSYPYVLVNRFILCNCHLESGLTYLLESLGSCSPSSKFIMFFTINSAFNHYMSLFGLSENETTSTELISSEHVFDIFLNNTLPLLLMDNSTLSLAPLQPPKTLLKLFQTMNYKSKTSPNSPFFHLWSIPVMKNLEKAHFSSLPLPTYCTCHQVLFLFVC